MGVGNRKKYLFTVLLVVTVFLAVLGIAGIKKKTVDTSEGINYIEQEEKKDIAEIEKKVQKIEETDGKVNEEKNYKAVFENSVIMGDSIVESIEEYEILSSSSVVAKIGASIVNLDDQIDTVVNLNPQTIFLSYGLNDISTTNGNTTLFIERYEKLLEKLQNRMPDARLFVNSIFPVLEKSYAVYPEYKDLDKYNIELKKMCEKHHIPFIDTASLVSDNDYEPDGIHFKASFYPLWLAQMSEVAGL